MSSQPSRITNGEQMSALAKPENGIMPRVLVVDDEDEVCQMIALCLKKSGIQINSVDSAHAACRVLDETYDAVLTDVMMPGEDGISLLGRIHQTWPKLPVIIMTGYAQLQMAVDAVKNGAFDFIYKPFDFDYLRKIVERAVNYSALLKMEENYRFELEEAVFQRTTELKEALAELDFARSVIQKNASDKMDFMANISHEMRTPMNGVVGALDLIAELGVSGVQSEYLSMARQSTDNMLSLIDQLLSFGGGAGQGGSSICYDLLDLTVVLGKLFEEHRPSFKIKGLTLDLRIAADVPHQTWTDKQHFKRIIEILLGNALKFTEKGGVFLDVSRNIADDNQENLLFSLCDSGIGVPEGMLERIFEPFVQGDGSFTRRHGGVGLGLAIAMQNAMLLNGKLWAENRPDGGSCFNFSMNIINP